MTETLKLTARQQQILDLVQSTIGRTGAPPTRAEIAAALGFRSPNAAEEHLQALARKGAIELLGGTSRGIRLKSTTLQAVNDARAKQQLVPSQPPPPLSLPLVGRVAAGHPILAEENITQSFVVEASLFQRRPDYLLRVKGMSMRDIGIMDGDLLAVKRETDARHGQIVVARLGDEVTVKRLHRTAEGFELRPENPEFQPIVVSHGSDEFHIEGVAVGLLRQNMLA